MAHSATRLTRLFPVVLLLAGCSLSSSSAHSASPGGESALSSPIAPSPSEAGAGLCPEPGQTRTAEIPVGDSSRLARIHVSSLPAPGPRPLVLVFHGYGGSPGDIEGYSGMSVKGDAAGFVAVYPAGIGGTPRWDTSGLTDIAFVDDLISALVAEGCADPDRVFAAGLSMGGAMTVALGCRLAGRILAMAPVAAPYGPNWVTDCTPSEPVPVIAFHGLDDPVVPYGGGSIGAAGTQADPLLPPVIGVEAWAAGWAAANGCGAQPVAQAPVGGALPLFWDDCDAPVHLYPVDGLGHAWPGSPQYAESATDLSATDLIWDFFSEFGT